MTTPRPAPLAFEKVSGNAWPDDRWAAVKRILTVNWDDRYADHIITPEFHASYRAWLESSR